MSTLTVTFRISAGFSHYVSNAAQFIAGIDCAIRADDTVADLLDTISFPGEMAMIVFVNGRLADKQSRLKDGDTIFLAQTIAGG